MWITAATPHPHFSACASDFGLSSESDSTVRWLHLEAGLAEADMSVASSVTSSAVSTVCLVRAVVRRPSARPPAKSLRAGGPGGEGGGGAMPGTSAPRGSCRLGVAAQEESPRPGRDEGRGERGRGEGGSPSLVQSLSLVSREMLGSRVQRKDWWPWGVRTATMSVWGTWCHKGAASTWNTIFSEAKF